MNRINSYPSIYALGHRAIADILSSPVVIEEKIDGSQFSMSRTEGVLSCRSKGKDLIVDAPEKMFTKAIITAQQLDLHDGWTYRCEYLQSPKHNTLAYARVPSGHLMVFDVCTGPETYLTPAEKRLECSRIGLECVPCFFDGFADAVPDGGFILSKGYAEELLSKESVLGGCKVEGFVIKNYSIFTPDKKIAIAKYVSEAFKEKHLKEWKSSNPTQTDVVQLIIAELKTNARWTKGVQHLREAGSLTETPQDIGPLLKEVQSDVKREESDYIKEKLFTHFWPQIQRGVIAGLPEFYKAHLASKTLQP